MEEENIEKIQEEDIINLKMKAVLEGGEILKIKSDRTFKALFNGNDKLSMKWFVAQILEQDIKDIKDVILIENNELAPFNMYDRKKTVDFIVSVSDDIIILELNNNNLGKDYTRNLFYTFHALLNKIQSGEEYREIHGYLINLNWFTKKEKEYYNMEGVTVVRYPYPKLGKEDTENIITVKNINLSFYNKMEYNGVKMKDFLWKLFTIDKVDELHDVEENIKELTYYCRTLERLSKDKEFCMLVWDEKIEEKFRDRVAYNDGVEAGIIEGKELSKKEIVVEFYKNGVSKEIISKSTGLSTDEIEKIIKENDK